MSAQTIERHGERARLATWRGEDRVAHLTPSAGPPLSTGFVASCVDILAGRGFRSVITGALSPTESAGFLQAGFSVHEHLILLSHDLAEVRRQAQPRTRRARRRDRAAVLAVDALAFDAFWRFHAGGLDEALLATPRRRFRVSPAGASPAGASPAGTGDLAGYAVTGRGARTGYLQRLAVHPDARGRGVGRALVADGLVWLRRFGGQRALVNTQERNEAALALYRSCGFREIPEGLQVLSRDLP